MGLLLALVIVGAIACERYRSPPTPPRPVDRPPPPVVHSRDEFSKRPTEDCSSFIARFRTIGFTDLPGALRQYRQVVPSINAQRAHPDRLAANAELQGQIAALPNASALFNDGNTFAIDTPLDIENFFVVYSFLEYLSGRTPPNTAGAVPSVWGLRLYGTSPSSSSIHLVLSSQDKKGLDEQLRECEFSIGAYAVSRTIASN